jgi:cell division protein FtsZ
MGMGLSEGEDRAMRSVNQALNSPLLDDNKIQGASDLLVNISYGEEEATMDEYAAINEFLQNEAGRDATLKCGLCYDASLGRAISVTVIATGFDRNDNRYKKELITEREIEFDLSMVNINEDGITKNSLITQKQTTIFDQLNDMEMNDSLSVDRKTEQMKQRMKYLRELNETSNKVNGLEELENVPAYKRKGVLLDEVIHSSDSEISRTSLIEEPDRKPELRTNNSFLHDNVD